MMDYITESLQGIYGLSLHWSSDCNMACKYCYIEKNKPCMEEYNAKIQASLEDGSFLANIKKVFSDENIRNQISDISLWGAEPTINGKYFGPFITELFDYFPNVHEFMFSTNALMGGTWIYEKFFMPLYDYCERTKRPINWNLQLSLDGPKEFNDDSRHAGATATTIEAAKILVTRAPDTSSGLSIRLTTKPTVDVNYMRIMNERGLEAFNWYFQFFNQVQTEVVNCLHQDYIQVQLNGIPTVVDPGCHTQDDGKVVAQWIHNLIYVDRRKIPWYNDAPLFMQFMSGIDFIVNDWTGKWNPYAQEYNAFSCSASKNNITIGYDGHLYTCNRLCKNAALTEDDINKHSMRANTDHNTSSRRWLMKTWGSNAFHSDLKSRRELFDSLAITLAKVGQIDPKYATDAQARTILFFATTGMTCHIGNEEDYTNMSSILPTSVLKLIGNGAIDELLKYYAIEQQRGDISHWRIATLM